MPLPGPVEWQKSGRMQCRSGLNPGAAASNPVQRNSHADIIYLRLASGLVTSRAHSMNNWATGVRVRHFSVTTPSGLGGTNTFTGNGLSDNRLALK
jgi:hypothetical protein